MEVDKTLVGPVGSGRKFRVSCLGRPDDHPFPQLVLQIHNGKDPPP